jgi:hypothetical protein
MNSKVIAITPAPRCLPIPPHGEAASGLARDSRGRGLRDLRISVTDRCNFRCVYCMPKEVFGRDYRFLAHDDLLTFEEIARVARVFVDKCLELLLEGKLDAATAAMAKYWTTDLEGKIIDECLQLHGGYGFMWEFPISQAYVDARVTRIYGGTNEIMKEVISRSLGLGGKDG